MALYGERGKRRRSLESIREDFLHQLQHNTSGLYFPSGSSVLSDRDADQRIAGVLCPGEAYDTVDKANKHIQQVFLECNRWWDLLAHHGSKKYWQTVAVSASEMGKIDLSRGTARELTLSILRARQRWLLRQDDQSEKGVSSLFIAAVQRLLTRFETQDAVDDPLREESGWQLTEDEKQAAREGLVQMGPDRQISKKTFKLSPRGPQKLYPISQLGGGRSFKSDWLGLVDEMVGTITPGEAIRALLPRSRSESVVPTTPRRTTKSSDPSLMASSPRSKMARGPLLKPLPFDVGSSHAGSPTGKRGVKESPTVGVAIKRRLSDGGHSDSDTGTPKKKRVDGGAASITTPTRDATPPVTPVKRMKWRLAQSSPLRPRKK